MSTVYSLGFHSHSLEKMAEEEECPFKAEYAKSSRAGCKQCKGNITKDTLRMAKMVQVGVSDHNSPQTRLVRLM